MEGGAQARALVPPAPQQAAMTANWLDQCARAHYACGDVVTAADIS